MVNNQTSISRIFDYHQRTKHGYYHLARSLGYLDWESQPNPFRYYEGAEKISLKINVPHQPVAFDDIFSPPPLPAQPLTIDTLSGFFRYSLGLSAWKKYRSARWALRVNPSSGNLHPTEGYAVCGPLKGLSEDAGVFHYVSENHLLEKRAVIPTELWQSLFHNLPKNSFLVGLSTIHWRESWKYGERAFRYCQHDTGHALAALRIAAAQLGWRLDWLFSWSSQQMASLLGLDRVDEFHQHEKEEPELLALVRPACDEQLINLPPKDNIPESMRHAKWFGKANTLSVDHFPWEVIDEAAETSRFPGLPQTLLENEYVFPEQHFEKRTHLESRRILLQRRSAVDFDGQSYITLDRFIRIIDSVLPRARCPWDVLFWPPSIHLALFVHRVHGLSPGIHVLVRHPQHEQRLRDAMDDSFIWKRPDNIPPYLPFYLLKEGNCTELATSISCMQAIAGESFFSLGMIANYSETIKQYGAWFYRNLFWEAGIIGQVLYLEAEAAEARSTGIGCFFDDPVHDVFGLKDQQFQSLYHFTIGIHVDDPRLTTKPPYT